MYKTKLSIAIGPVGVIQALTVSLAADYQTAVLADGPQAYYQFNDSTNRSLIHKNYGSLGAAGNATNDLPTGVVQSVPGAIVGDGNRAAFFDGTTRTEVPFNAAMNPPNTQPFSVEVWLCAYSDQSANGMAPVANRFGYSGQNRQGWVFFQRKPDFQYNGAETAGWNFRMYNAKGSSTAMDTTSRVPFLVGKWQHIVVTYDPVQLSNSVVTMYIDGVPVTTNTWAGGSTGTDPGYVANSGDQVGFTPPNFSIGSYNNANTTLNSWFGAADEFAFYNSLLSAEQIEAHYQNATNASRTLSYSQLILSHSPSVYLRLDGVAPSANVAINYGALQSTGYGTNTAEVNHPVASPLVASSHDGAASYHWRNGNSTTSIPYRATNNPPANIPFTFEAWLKASNDRQNPGAAVVANRYISSGKRTGWVIFQRAPNTTYAGVDGYSGVGWAFRMYNGSNTGGSDATTDFPCAVGEWQHLVVTWEPQTDVGPAANGSVAYQGILSAYINGVLVKQNFAATYCANTNPTEDATAASDLAIGSYNAASGLGSNPFEGSVDEVAFYNGIVLTPTQIQEHYTAGTDANFGTPYEALVMMSGLQTQANPGNELTGLPTTYLRFNERTPNLAANSGALGYLADANQITTSNSVAGPRSPSFAGFSSTNTAAAFNGTKQWVSLQNPVGLNFAGQISVEAWVQPGATQANPARIVSHGPEPYSFFLAGPLPTDYGAPTNGNELFLQVEGTAPNYSYTFGSSSFTNGIGTSYHKVTAAAPATDFGNGTWVHLVGTYDGSNWRLYRNGVQLAAASDPVGALTVDAGNWAIGASGIGWTNHFTGAIDEPAIYSSALSASAVANHYVIGKGGTTALTIASAGGNNVTITWPAGTTLQSSTTGVTGSFTDVSGSPVSPLTIPASGTVFYRWRL